MKSFGRQLLGLLRFAYEGAHTIYEVVTYNVSLHEYLST